MIALFEAFELRDLVTIGLSALALALSWWTATRTGRLNRRTFDLARRQGDSENLIAATQAELAREQTRLARDTDIIRWSAEVARALAEMAEWTRDDAAPAERATRWHKLRARLSADIDVGRLYFPNYAEDIVNTDTAPAYRGAPQEAVAHLIAAYDAFSACGAVGATDDDALLREKGAEIDAAKRRFISEVHEHIDPRRYVEFLDSDAIEALKAEVEAGAAEDAAQPAAPKA